VRLCTNNCHGTIRLQNGGRSSFVSNFWIKTNLKDDNQILRNNCCIRPASFKYISRQTKANVNEMLCYNITLCSDFFLGLSRSDVAAYSSSIFSQKFTPDMVGSKLKKRGLSCTSLVGVVDWHAVIWCWLPIGC